MPMQHFENLKGFVAAHLKWIVAGVLLFGVAFLMWPHAVQEQTDIVIPLDFGKTAAGLTIAEANPKSIEVRVEGPERVLKTLAKHKLSYKLDLSRLGKGLMSIPLDMGLIDLPRRVKIISASQKTVLVKIEMEITRQVTVKVVLSGKPAAGFTVADAVSRPADVFLRGPASILSAFAQVDSKPIDVNGLTESVKREIALKLPAGVDVIFPSGIMRADVFVEPKIITKKFVGLTVEGKNVRYQYSINPALVDIVVSGQMITVEKLEPSRDIKIYVDLKDLKPGVYPRRATLALPVDVSLVDVKPEIFTVKIEKKKRK